MGRPWERPAHLETVFERTRGVLVFDDMNYHELRNACAALASAKGRPLRLLEAETTDQFGRFLGRIDRHAGSEG